MTSDSRQQIQVMLELQESMNTKVHPVWRQQGFAWYRAIWVECAELMDHYGWKWWKKQQPDMEQVKLEIIDIWHFGLSHLLNTSAQPLDVLASAIASDMENRQVAVPEFRVALEEFTEWTLVHRGFDTRHFSILLAAAGVTFQQLYAGYIGKNVLNFFRQDHGYQQGTYRKVWQGREDNEHLAELCASLDVGSTSFKEDLYKHLASRYKGELARAG